MTGIAGEWKRGGLEVDILREEQTEAIIDAHGEWLLHRREAEPPSA